jgi:hypothetical protein
MAFDFLKKVETAAPKAQTPYIQFLPDKGQASYLLKVNRLALDKAQFQGFEFFLVDAEVVESNHPEFPKGSLTCRMMPFYGGKQNENKDKKSAEEMKAFFVALTGLPASEITEKDILEACSEKQPLAGTLVRCNAFHHLTKKNTDFTKCVWNHVSTDPTEVVAPANDNGDE